MSRGKPLQRVDSDEVVIVAQEPVVRGREEGAAAGGAAAAGEGAGGGAGGGDWAASARQLITDQGAEIHALAKEHGYPLGKEFRKSLFELVPGRWERDTAGVDGVLQELVDTNSLPLLPHLQV